MKQKKRFYLSKNSILSLAIVPCVAIVGSIAQYVSLRAFDPSLFLVWWGVCLLGIAVTFVATRRGCTYAEITAEGIAHYWWPLRKQLLCLRWDEVAEVYVTQALFPDRFNDVLLVFSSAPIEGTPISKALGGLVKVPGAATYTPLTQIPLRVTKKNFAAVLPYVKAMNLHGSVDLDLLTYEELVKLAALRFTLTRSEPEID